MDFISTLLGNEDQPFVNFLIGIQPSPKKKLVIITPKSSPTKQISPTKPQPTTNNIKQTDKKSSPIKQDEVAPTYIKSGNRIPSEAEALQILVKIIKSKLDKEGTIFSFNELGILFMRECGYNAGFSGLGYQLSFNLCLILFKIRENETSAKEESEIPIS